MSKKINYSKKYTIVSDVLIQEIVDGESVLLNLETESYFGLDKMGRHFWKAITQSESLQKAYDTLMDEYDVDPELLRKDLNELVKKLLEKGLIKVNDK